MKEISEAIDRVLAFLAKRETDWAIVELIALKAKLHSRKEQVKISREMSAKKKVVIDSLKKLKL